MPRRAVRSHVRRCAHQKESRLAVSSSLISVCTRVLSSVNRRADTFPAFRGARRYTTGYSLIVLSENFMKRPPGPKPHFLIGNMPLASRDSLAVFSKWGREFGDIFYYRAAWLHVYFLNHPDLIEAVLVRNYQNFLKDRVVQKSRWFFGDGLLTNEGDSWLRQRRLSQPAFHRERVASYAKIMTDYAQQMLATWSDGEIRDVHQEMMRLTLRIVVRALFNVETEEVGKISLAMNILMRNSTGIRLLLPPVARYLPTLAMIEFRRAVRQMDETVYGIIATRRASGGDSGDLLSMLMQARDE